MSSTAPSIPLELKGSNFTLSVLYLYESQATLIGHALQQKMAQAPAFFKDAPIVVNVSALPAQADWSAIYQQIIANGLRIVGVSGCQNQALKQAVLQSGLPLLTEGKSQPQKPSAKTERTLSVVNNKTRIVDTPVRSGQQIYARDADLIVTNSVSAGAELIADGNIHIYGSLRGRVLAGASGDSASQIFCQQLSAELVSIAGQYWLSEQIPNDFINQAVNIKLDNNQLIITKLN